MTSSNYFFRIRLPRFSTQSLLRRRKTNFEIDRPIVQNACAALVFFVQTAIEQARQDCILQTHAGFLRMQAGELTGGTNYASCCDTYKIPAPDEGAQSTNQ